MSERKMIQGVTVNMGGDDYIIPPLTLGQIEDSEADFKNLDAGDARTQFDAMAKMIHTAMLRNYPDMTIDHLKRDLLDMGNVFTVTEAVMGNSGLLKRVGEALAGRSLTGQTSMPA